MMPEIDGIALLRSALAIDANLVGIMMTGHGTIDTAVEAMKAGALDYILKPFKLSAVIPVLARALTVRRLRQENAALQRRVNERTLQLEAANRELEAFATSIAHDLGAPARHIFSFAGMLKEKLDASAGPEALRYLQVISDASERMGRLITDMLGFSRLARAEMQRYRVDLGALVAEVQRELQPETGGRAIEWKIGALPTVQGDRSMLKQVFCNLLSNAVKYSRGRNPAVIEVGCREAEGELTCSVRDNGAGFAMENAKKLFGIFQRLHPANEFEGSGVGLSIVQRIVQRHGGRIWAEAERDRGATFFFTLPASSSDDPIIK
jgi:hypothetical protein